MSVVRSVVGGVDIHADFDVAAAVDGNGGLLGIESFPVDEAGFEELLGWLFGPVSLVGVEGTGSWGVGLARFLAGAEVEVVEVDPPTGRLDVRSVGRIRPMRWRRLEPPSLGRRRWSPRHATGRWNRCGSCWWLVVPYAGNGSKR